MLFRSKIFVTILTVGLLPAAVLLVISAYLINSTLKRVGASGLETSVEAAIRGEMARVLGRAVGGTATFWELGGTSLKAMMLDGWLQREFGVGVGMGAVTSNVVIALVALS